MKRREVKQEENPATKRVGDLLICRKCQDYRDQMRARMRNAEGRMRMRLSADEEVMTTVDRILDTNQSVVVVKILGRLQMHRIDRGLMKMIRRGGERTIPILNTAGAIATAAIDVTTMTAIDVMTKIVLDVKTMTAIDAMTKIVIDVKTMTAIDAMTKIAIDVMTKIVIDVKTMTAIGVVTLETIAVSS